MPSLDGFQLLDYTRWFRLQANALLDLVAARIRSPLVKQELRWLLIRNPVTQGEVMAMDLRKKREVRDSEFFAANVEIDPPKKGETGAFSRTKHRYYTTGGLERGFDNPSSRTTYLLQKIVEIYSQRGDFVPYAFEDRLGKRWSMDAGCLDAIGPEHQKYVKFRVRDGYIIGVEPTPKLLAEFGAYPSIGADIKDLLQDRGLKKTEREQLIAARVGQGDFRQQLLTKWDHQCAVTSCNLPAVLKASHIVAWRDATNGERLDCENGLLLVATLDALFDAGFVSFDDHGKILAKPSMGDYPNLIESTMRLSKQPSEKMRAYLSRHRKVHGF